MVEIVTAIKDPIQDILNTVKSEILTFESRKLVQFKGELESFLSKKTTVVDEYRKKYPGLVEAWKAMNTRIEQAHVTLKCRFPNGQWKTYLQECACDRRQKLAGREAALAIRMTCGAGDLEKARDGKKAKLDAAKTYLDTMIANAGKCDAALTANGKTAGVVEGLSNGPKKAVALQWLWLDLLPAHIAMAPGNLPPGCLAYAQGEEPWAICTSIPAPADDAARAVPWLINPDDYGNALDDAWMAYRAARDASADADKKFADTPDDIATLAKLLAADEKARDDEIRKCLGDKPNPGPDCETPAVARPNPAQTVQVPPADSSPASVAQPAAPKPEPAKPGPAKAAAAEPEPDKAGAEPAEPAEPEADPDPNGGHEPPPVDRT